MYLAYYSRQFYLTIRFNLKLKFKVSSDLATFGNLRTTSGNFACLHSVLGAPFDIQDLRERNKIPMLVTWIKTTKKNPEKEVETEKGTEIETKRERENWKKGSKNQTENGKQRTKKGNKTQNRKEL